MGITFTTTVIKGDEGGNATGLEVPPDVVAALGSTKRPPVVVTINGYSYRSTVAPYSGVFMLPLAAEHRNAAGVQAGDQVEVTLELDTQPRTVEVPDDLQAALAAAGVQAAFEGMSYTNRKEAVRSVNDAKTQETRQRRIANIVTKLTGG